MRLNKASLWLSALLVIGGGACGEDPEKKPQLSAVTVTCTPTTVATGQSAQCTASATDQDGKPFSVTGYTWTSSNESVAKVDSTGKATTFTPGTANLSASATADGVTQQGQATLTVTEIPPQLSTITVKCEPTSVPVDWPSQCTASAMDQYGQPFAVSNYTWTSSNESVAKVDSTGKATAVSAGVANLVASATAGGITQQGQASLTVIQPTLHDANITASETWRSADNPHLVRGVIEVNGGSVPTLTLEPGVVVLFDLGARLRVSNGALRALGTQEAPIRMEPNQSMPTQSAWRGVTFSTAGSASEMNHVTVSNCGESFGGGNCITIVNQAAPVLRHVTVRNSNGIGVLVADDGSAFGPGSTTLNVSGSGLYPVRIGANQADTLPPDSTYTDNGDNFLGLLGNVSRTQTLPNSSIPYMVTGYMNIEGPTRPTLTIPAGTEVYFETNTLLFVGQNAPGELIVGGTQLAPVRITSRSPTPGNWQGVHLGKYSSSATRLSYTTIEYAGVGDIVTGNLNIYGDGSGGGARPVIDNVTVRGGSKYGVYLEADGAFGPDSTSLSAIANGGYAISVLANHAGSIPSGGTFSDNTSNAVEIRSGNVTTTQTWPKLGIPYVIKSMLNVGNDRDEALLLLPAGTELRFAQGQGLTVGFNNTVGRLGAEGTKTEKVRFVPDVLEPTKGYWRGLHLWYADGSALTHAIVTHAGAEGSGGTGNVNLYREIGIFMTSTALTNSSGCGLTVSDGSRPDSEQVTTDHTGFANTFVDNDGGPVCKN